MSTQKIKVLFAEHKQTQQQFIHFSQTISALQLQLSQRRVALSGEWTGQSWSSFMNEMDLDIIPALGRLSRAMGSVEQFLADASLQLEEVEKEGAASIAQLNHAQSPRPDGRDAIGDFPDGSSVEDHKLPPDGMSNHNITNSDEFSDIIGSPSVRPLTWAEIETFIDQGMPPPRVFIVNGINDITGLGYGGFTIGMTENLVAAGYPPDEIVLTEQIYKPWESGYRETYGVDFSGTNISSWLPHSLDAALFDLTTNWAAQTVENQINGSLRWVDSQVDSIFRSESILKWTGMIDVWTEYYEGSNGQYTQSVYSNIEESISTDPLLPGQSIALIGHSGGGAPMTNVSPMIVENLDVNISLLNSVGSPVANFDLAEEYADTRVESSHEHDWVATPLIRSEETRILAKYINNIYASHAQLYPILPDNLQPGIIAVLADPLFRNDKTIKVVTGNDLGLPDESPYAEIILAAHSSYKAANNQDLRESLNENGNLGLSTDPILNVDNE